MNRPCIELSGTWLTVSDGDDRGAGLGYAATDFDAAGWTAAAVPGVVDRITPGLDGFNAKVWYRRSVEIPADWAGGRVALCFEGANYHTQAWVNGECVGQNCTGFLPFEFAVDNALRPGERNQIAVCVDSVPLHTENPGKRIGWQNFGGILRPVRLERRAITHIAAIRTVARPIPGGGSLGVEVDLVNPGAGQITVTLCDEYDLPLAKSTFKANATTVAMEPVCIAGVRPWTPDDPALYCLIITLEDAGGKIDQRELAIGFRTIEAEDGKLLLNGEPIYLCGYNRHEDSPATDMAADMQTVERDLRQMKLGGANFVRLCHYPHDAREAELCDRLGLLVMAEIPVYWLNDPADRPEECPGKVSQAADQLARMIARDRNHPSIIVWSVSNETDEAQPAVESANNELIRQAHQLDPTRLVTHVSHRWSSHPDRFADDDVICVNGYPNVWPWQPAPATPAESVEVWRASLEQLHQRYPLKPIMVSEFGHPGIEGQTAGRWGLDRQAQVIVTEFAAFDAPYVCGAVVWCWADHAWPVREFCGGLSVSPFGVVTRDRQFKPAYSAITNAFRRRHNLPTDRPMTLPSGPSDVVMVCRQIGDVPTAPLPEGYRFEPITEQTASLWMDIWRDVDVNIKSDDALFKREFGTDWDIIAQRCWLIRDRRNRAVATISAWFDHRPGQDDIGRIHWVAVRPPWQGCGLARPMMSQAMQVLAACHRSAHLTTQAYRIPAITLYLRYGFVPQIADESARLLWSHVATRLGHPAIETALDKTF